MRITILEYQSRGQPHHHLSIEALDQPSESEVMEQSSEIEVDQSSESEAMEQSSESEAMGQPEQDDQKWKLHLN